MSDPSRQVTDTFLHYGASNSQVNGSVRIEATTWHNWVVEWTPSGITTYVDGVKWRSTTDTSILPPRSMHPTLQLDWGREALADAGGLGRLLPRSGHRAHRAATQLRRQHPDPVSHPDHERRFHAHVHAGPHVDRTARLGDG